MPQYQVDQLYLGKFGDLDPHESMGSVINANSENEPVPGWGSGTRFTIENATYLTLTQNDVVTDPKYKGQFDEDGEFIHNRLEENDHEQAHLSQEDPDITNNKGADSYTYTRPGEDEPVTSKIDSISYWNVIVTSRISENEWEKKPTVVGFVQLENGDVFTNIGEHDQYRSPFLGDPFSSIKLVSPSDSDTFGFLPRYSMSWLDTYIIEGPACFDSETLIETADGPCAIKDLVVGQQVLTVDWGFQPIRWIGSRKFDAVDLQLNPKLRPIRICADALGMGHPSRDLLVSPQHRILVRSALAQRMFNATEALIAAKHLLVLPSIEIANDLTEVEYFHMLFDRHQVIWSNGAATESLYTGKQALKSLSQAQVTEIFAIFPELREMPEGLSQPNDDRLAPARYLVPGRKGRSFARRLHKRSDRHAYGV